MNTWSEKEKNVQQGQFKVQLVIPIIPFYKVNLDGRLTAADAQSEIPMVSSK